MIRSMVNALAKRLKEIFPGCNIYDEFVKQNLLEPCFYISVISSDIKKEMDNRYRFRTSLDVSYFNGKHNEEMNDDFYNIIQKFYENIEVLEAGLEKYRINGKQHRVVDNVLHFLLDIRVNLIKEKVSDVYMQTLVEEARLKDG